MTTESRMRELAAFAEERSRDYNQPNGDIAAYRDIATALRELRAREQHDAADSAAPTVPFSAPSVDLQQFRNAVLAYRMAAINPFSRETIIADADRLMALIDAQPTTEQSSAAAAVKGSLTPDAELEQRARELLTTEYVRDGMTQAGAKLTAEAPISNAAIRAIVTEMRWNELRDVFDTKSGQHQYLLDLLGAASHADAGAVIHRLLAAARLNEPSGNSGQLAGWQPIETAPKDSTFVILALTGEYEPAVGEARWVPDDSDDGGAWWWAGTGTADYWTDPITETSLNPITHWMPMPGPPIAHAGVEAI